MGQTAASDDKGHITMANAVIRFSVLLCQLDESLASLATINNHNNISHVL